MLRQKRRRLVGDPVSGMIGVTAVRPTITLSEIRGEMKCYRSRKLRDAGADAGAQCRAAL